MQEHGFSLCKTTFHDVLASRYSWLPLVYLLTVLVEPVLATIDHSLSCPNGGFPSIHHNKVRYLTAKLLSKVRHNVEVEPYLQPLNDETFYNKTLNTKDGAWLDISMTSFFGSRFI